jgi:hypothetical protein
LLLLAISIFSMQARVALTRALADGNYGVLIDPRLDGDYDKTEAARVVACAAASIRHADRQRPKMSQVLCSRVPLRLRSRALKRS